jgi:hypothetical protein
MPGTIGVDRAKQPGSLNRLRQAQKLEIVPSCSTGKAEQICPVQEKPQAGQNQSSWPGVVPARRYPYRVLFAAGAQPYGMGVRDAAEAAATRSRGSPGGGGPIATARRISCPTTMPRCGARALLSLRDLYRPAARRSA